MESLHCCSKKKTVQTFKKQERLVEKKLITQVFENGKSFYFDPFRIIYLPYTAEGDFPVKVMISVSSRNFKRAVDRNRIKRLVRESYRINKEQLYSVFKNDEKWALVMIYNSKNILEFKELEAKIILILRRLVKEYEKGTG